MLSDVSLNSFDFHYGIIFKMTAATERQLWFIQTLVSNEQKL